MCPQKIITRAKVPLKCNFANKSALFPQAAPCPFSILGRTLNTDNSIMIMAFMPQVVDIQRITVSVCRSDSDTMIRYKLRFRRQIWRTITKQTTKVLCCALFCSASARYDYKKNHRNSASSRIRFLPVQAQPTAARSSRRAVVAHGRHIGRYFYLIILPLLIILLSLKSNFIIL